MSTYKLYDGTVLTQAQWDARVKRTQSNESLGMFIVALVGLTPVVYVVMHFIVKFW
jgi:hypothetical protein